MYAKQRCLLPWRGSTAEELESDSAQEAQPVLLKALQQWGLAASDSPGTLQLATDAPRRLDEALALASLASLRPSL